MTLCNPYSPTGHFIRRWNYPPDYRVSARMPARVLAEIRKLEADTAVVSPVPALARELAERSYDFRKLDAKYASSEGTSDPAHTYWPEAYLGVIETADWLGFEAQGAPKAWAEKIFPSVLNRPMRGLPSDEGLSRNFQRLLKVLEDRIAWVARTAVAEAVAFGEIKGEDGRPELQTEICLTAGQAMKNLVEVFALARDEFAMTPADRFFKMRVIEMEYGPRLMIRLHAMDTIQLVTRCNLPDLLDLLRLQRRRETRMKPRRLDYKSWSWIYSNAKPDA